MPDYTIDQIEDGIIALLQADTTYLDYPTGPKVKTIETYCGDFDEIQEQMLSKYPAIFVVFGESTYTPETTHSGVVKQFTRELRFYIFTASANLRSEEKRRGEAYELLEAVRKILTGQTLGMEIGAIEPLSEKIIFNTPQLTAYMAEYVTEHLTGID